MNIFKKKKSIDNKEMLQKALMAFSRNDIDISDELMKVSNNSQELAQQLYWFIPNIFFKVLFLDVEFVSDEYTVMYPDNSKKVFLFSDNVLYEEIFSYVKSNYTTLERQSILNILSHSAEFDVVNLALNNGSQLEDLRLTGPVYVIAE